MSRSPSPLESFMGFAQASLVAHVSMHPSLIVTGTSKKRFRISCVKLNGDNDPLLLSATAYASLRYQETLRPGKLTHLSLSFRHNAISFRHFIEHLEDVGE